MTCLNGMKTAVQYTLLILAYDEMGTIKRTGYEVKIGCLKYMCFTQGWVYQCAFVILIYVQSKRRLNLKIPFKYPVITSVKWGDH